MNPRIDVPPNSPFASPGLSSYEAALRHYVVAGDSAALETIEAAGHGDRLIFLLNRGLFLHRLGRYEESNAALQEAEAIAEDRYTKSIGQNIAAFLISDNVIDYTPPAHERAMIHYYGMLNYLALGNLEDALVEARRANEFLARYGRDNEGHRTYTNDALVQYLAGLLHWTGGDDNDALVSLRQADAAFNDYHVHFGIDPPAEFGRDLVRFAERVGVEEVVEDARARFGLDDESLQPTEPTGELLVIVENGFIAYRAEQKLYIPVLKSERQGLSSGESDSVLAATAAVMARTVLLMNQASKEARSYLTAHEDGLLVGSILADADLISFAWPSYEMDAHAVTDVVVQVGEGGALHTAAVFDDLSAIAARDYEERKPKAMARMVARGLLKDVAATKAESSAEKRGGALAGFLARVGARTFTTLTERADVRSWSLLPDELRAARVSLPPGEYPVSVRVRDVAGPPRTIDLGTVTIRPGQLTVRSAFLTGAYRGDAQRFQLAVAEVDYEDPEVWPKPPGM